MARLPLTKWCGKNGWNFIIGRTIHLTTHTHLAFHLTLTPNEPTRHKCLICAAGKIRSRSTKQVLFKIPQLLFIFKSLRVLTSERVQHPRKLGQALSAVLCTILPVFPQSMWKSCTVLCCTRTTLTPTPAHTNTSWHTYWLLWTKWAYARRNAHGELLWTFPSNVYASATIKPRQTATWDHF